MDKKSEVMKTIVSISNYFDEIGLKKEADILDNIMEKVAIIKVAAVDPILFKELMSAPWADVVSRHGTEVLSSQFIEDGSYFTLKNLSISYTFIGIEAFETIGLDALKIYGSVENLFILTGYTGYDPESTSTGGSDVDLGIDLNAYPLSRTFTAGVKFTF